ncbi:hypothetical protein [Gulosibacter molinativorax]|uniref:Tripartite tricarboxylate transporter TctB family protein n=1 Tax=Gulosibacter molinativorax TaxID=256821 RepID=A0ABT7CBF7_9MICO|nr:hypothetical protein [Gulosibacter molinativorax]MDJ1372490.1 hypothetical protein [Gulosibacter molinativorax]QUY61933.1 Hypotetical protein [Gulosibacter molinativorax]
MDDDSLPDAPPGVPKDRHLLREWMEMGIYIAISLLASIGTIVETGNPGQSPLPALWGIIIGLLIAHTFAFSLASIATDTRDNRREDLLHSASGVAGGLSVGVAITIVSLILPTHWETAAISIVLIVYLSLAAVVVARSRKASWWRTVIITAIVLALALVIIFVKQQLSH